MHRGTFQAVKNHMKQHKPMAPSEFVQYLLVKAPPFRKSGADVRACEVRGVEIPENLVLQCERAVSLFEETEKLYSCLGCGDSVNVDAKSWFLRAIAAINPCEEAMVEILRQASAFTTFEKGCCPDDFGKAVASNYRFQFLAFEAPRMLYSKPDLGVLRQISEEAESFMPPRKLLKALMHYRLNPRSEILLGAFSIQGFALRNGERFSLDTFKAGTAGTVLAEQLDLAYSFSSGPTGSSPLEFMETWLSLMSRGGMDTKSAIDILGRLASNRLSFEKFNDFLAQMEYSISNAELMASLQRIQRDQSPKPAGKLFSWLQARVFPARAPPNIP